MGSHGRGATGDCSAGAATRDLKARAFLSNKRGGRAKEAAVKAFFEHCPQALITTNMEAANYIVDLVPASLKQTKNSVVVRNTEAT
jgi:hypothetical protein